MAPASPATDVATPHINMMSYERVTAEMRKAAPGTTEQIQTFLTVVRGGRCSQTEISRSPASRDSPRRDMLLGW
jgi:hypothetical protein